MCFQIKMSFTYIKNIINTLEIYIVNKLKIWSNFRKRRFLQK